jgi:hypothetical protein
MQLVPPPNQFSSLIAYFPRLYIPRDTEIEDEKKGI